MNKNALRLIVLACLLLLTENGLAQKEQVSSFRLPINTDEGTILSSLTVNCAIKEYKSFYIDKEISNPKNPAAEKYVCDLFSLSKKGEKNKYLSLSGSKDSIVEISYRFYNIIFAHAINPQILFCAEVGPMMVYYIQTEPGLPLITIGIMRVNGRFINAAKYVNDAVVASLNATINEYMKHPEIKVPQARGNMNRSVIGIHKLLDMDTSINISYSLNAVRVNYNMKNTKDSSNSSPGEYKGLLAFCASSLDMLARDSKSEYLNSFTQKSKTNLQEVFGNTPASETKYREYKKFRLFYDRIGLVVDLGDAFIIIYRHHGNIHFREFYDYVLKVGNGYKFCNAGNEFFLDDLLRREDFSNALKFN